MGGLRIRKATIEDAPLILAFIKELAAFENEPDAVRNSEAAIRAQGFGADPAFEVLIAEAEGPDGLAQPAGMALFYHTYSTWTGRRGLYVDDLFVRAPFRGTGVGRALLQAAARVAIERGCPRLDLQVLDWNSARAFYERLGFRHKDEWLPYRLAGDALVALAAAPSLEKPEH
jgi:GNAT superfamily N-acetyltransferase